MTGLRTLLSRIFQGYIDCAVELFFFFSNVQPDPLSNAHLTHDDELHK